MTAALTRPAGTRAGTGAGVPPRVGIVNLMPHAEQYASWLMPQLAAALPIDPQWIRVAQRRYRLDEPSYIDGLYRPYDEVVAEGPLDGLIVTGAAVEHLPYEEVRFLPELAGMVGRAADDGIPILGLCWGALGVGHLLYDLPKRVHRQKVSGMYLTDRLVDDGPIAEMLDDRFWSTHSRFAGFDDAALDRTPGIRAVARSAETGTVIAESADHGVVLHIGHPEYAATRLVDEYRRDLAQQLPDVRPPANVDLDRPANLWRSHSRLFFASWVRLVHTRAGLR